MDKRAVVLVRGLNSDLVQEDEDCDIDCGVVAGLGAHEHVFEGPEEGFAQRPQYVDDVDVAELSNEHARDGYLAKERVRRIMRLRLHSECLTPANPAPSDGIS